MTQKHLVRPNAVVYEINDRMLDTWRQERRPQPARLLVRGDEETDAIFQPYVEQSARPDRVSFRWGELEIFPCPDVAEGIAVLVSGDNPPVEIPLR